MDENDILGFDPSQLSVFSPVTKNNGQGNPLMYHTRPTDAKNDEHIYTSLIKVIYSPQDIKHSILERQYYAMQDKDGYFSATSSLTNNDTNCPIFKAWKKCHFAKKEENPTLWAQAAKPEDGGHNVFDKRYERLVTIQVLEDKNQPDLVGKYLFWKMPKSVWETINAKMNPAKDSGKAGIPVMDFLFGRAIELTVKPGPGKPGDTSFTRETSYLGEITEDIVPCTNPDGSDLLNATEKAVYNRYVDAMKEVWKDRDANSRQAKLAAINADANTVEFRKIYAKVLENLKTFCPDLNKELGYHPWDEALAKRVQAWIDVVLSGNNPAQADDVPAAITEAPLTPESAVFTNPSAGNTDPFTGAPAQEDPNDDLPF